MSIGIPNGYGHKCFVFLRFSRKKLWQNVYIFSGMMLRKEKKLKVKVKSLEKKRKKLITGQKFYWSLEKDYQNKSNKSHSHKLARVKKNNKNKKIFLSATTKQQTLSSLIEVLYL